MGFLLAIGDRAAVNSGRNCLHPNPRPRYGQVTRSLQTSSFWTSRAMSLGI